MGKRPGFMVYFNDAGFFMGLDDAQLGALFRAMLGYAMAGEMPENLPENLRPLFHGMAAKIDKDEKRYQEISEKRREAGKKGMATRWAEDNNDNKSYQEVTNITNSNSNSNSKLNNYAENFEKQPKNGLFVEKPVENHVKTVEKPIKRGYTVDEAVSGINAAYEQLRANKGKEAAV